MREPTEYLSQLSAMESARTLWKYATSGGKDAIQVATQL
jgi:hypothetical protein